MTDHEDPSGVERPEAEDSGADDDRESASFGSSTAGSPFGAGAFGAMPSMSGLGDLFGQAHSHLQRASEQAGGTIVTGRAGGGSVEVTVNGNLEAISVRISPDVARSSDVGLLEDLVLAALRDALGQVVELRQEAASSMLPPSFDLGSMMQGLFGGGGGSEPGAAGTLDALPGGLEGFSDLVNGLLGPDGPIIDFDPDDFENDDDDFEDDDDDADGDDDDDDVDADEDDGPSGGAPA